ncbi:energy transducer TonB [Flexithrix dorotheae]|uniref:energy transducer TonB n=1 Tax=Flexithrix dorotheae TaxID=70993 RepID=UPI00037D870F|nr:energy transducer TonB [Flexithrix dorotheae]
MTTFLNTLGFPGVIIGLILMVIGMIYLLKYLIHRQEKQLLKYHPESNTLSKKYPGVDLENYRGLIFKLGLILSLAFVLAVFEYPTFEEDTLVELQGERAEYDEMQEIPPTEHKPPPPPKIMHPEIVEVPNEEEIEQEIEIDLDVEADEEAVVEEVQEILVEEDVDEEEEFEEIFQIVEDPAEPIGGYKAFYAFVGENLKYPRKALDLSVEGRVYIKFVVDKDGSLTNLQIARGIGAGCDEEALRVMSKAPKWKPGKQRGRAVRQQMVIPIVFKLIAM